MQTKPHEQLVQPAQGLDSTPSEVPPGVPPPGPSPAESVSTLSGERQALHVESDHGAGNAVPIGVTRGRDRDYPLEAIPDEHLTTADSMRLRMRELIARVIVLSERIAATGITREELRTPVKEQA